MLVEEPDRGRPVRLLRRRIGEALRVARRERGDVPRERQQEGDRRERERPPAPQRERQDRERDGGETKPRHVLAETGRDQERGHTDREIEDVQPPEHPRFLHVPREDDAEDAEHAHSGQLLDREREAAAGREDPPENEPHGRERSHGHGGEGELDPGRQAGEADRRQQQHEQRERKRAGREAEDGQHGEAEAGARLERPQRQQREGCAEREGIGAGENDARPDHGERPARPACGGTPLARGDHRERERGRGDAEHRQQLDPEERRGRVVEEAVRDEAVAALVPEVVPELEAVVAEEPALVDVRGQVASRRAEGNQQRRNECGESEGKKRLRRKGRDELFGAATPRALSSHVGFRPDGTDRSA